MNNINLFFLFLIEASEMCELDPVILKGLYNLCIDLSYIRADKTNLKNIQALTRLATAL